MIITNKEILWEAIDEVRAESILFSVLEKKNKFQKIIKEMTNGYSNILIPLIEEMKNENSPGEFLSALNALYPSKIVFSMGSRREYQFQINLQSYKLCKW